MLVQSLDNNTFKVENIETVFVLFFGVSVGNYDIFFSISWAIFSSYVLKITSFFYLFYFFDEWVQSIRKLAGFSIDIQFNPKLFSKYWTAVDGDPW